MAFNADGDGVNGAGSQHRRPDYSVRSARVCRVHFRAWHACREAFRNLGDPAGFSTETGLRNEPPHGIRLFSHGRGNPDTEANRSLNEETPHSNARRGRPARPKEEQPMVRRESDPLIVLGDGRAAHRGKGRTEVRSWQRKHCPATSVGFSNANLTAGNSNDDADGESLLRIVRYGSEYFRRARC